MEHITLAKNYNIVEEKEIYINDLADSIDLIKKAQSEKIINEIEASFLLRMVLKNEFKNEVRAILPFTEKSSDIISFFMNLKTKHIKHA